MGIFECFSLGGRPAARRVHAKGGRGAVEGTLALPKVDTDEHQVFSEVQGTHIADSRLGKPFDVDKLGPCLPPDNEARLDTLSCVLEATDPDPALTPILQLLCKILHVETACVTMIVENGIQVKEGIGLLSEKAVYPQPGVCHWMLVPDKPHSMVVEDMHLDARTSTRSVVTQAPHMRFYASAPLVASNGHVLGSLCIWDVKPRAFDSSSTAILSNFAELMVRELEMHAVLQRQLSMAQMLQRAMDCYHQGYLFVDVAAPGWRIMHVNQAFSTCTGMTREQAVEACFWDIFQTPSSDVEEPWRKHDGMLAERRPFQLNSLRCTAQASSNKNSYSAVIRPASTDKVDESALLIGIPAGSFAREAVQGDGNYFFVVLRAPQEVFRRQLPSPIEGLRLGAQLGAGSQGRVYRGTLDGIPIAVKVVDNANTLRKIGTMPLEAALLQDMRHDSIVNLLKHKFATTSQQERQLWLGMEYCDKGPLDVAVDKGLFRTAPNPKAQPCLETILQTALEVAVGLAFLHSHCVVHCDLSGGNILLRDEPARPHGFSAKISDFGMCRIKDVEVLESLQGTYSHMAPEVIQNKGFSEASDVYSFGVLLWEMYNGQRAWAGLLFAQLSYAMFVEKHSLQFPEGTPEGFRALALSCLSVLPADRPSSKDLPAKLRALIAQQEVQAPAHSL